MAPSPTSYGRLLAGMHIAAVVFVAMLVAAVIVLAVYHWRRYGLYKRARLIPDSPYVTPPSTPSKDVVTGSSTLTLTEIISLKSLRLRSKIPVSLPIRTRIGRPSYTSVDEEQADLGARRSLPNSPFMTRRICTPTMLRRSSSQLGRILRRGSGNFKRKKRRFASVDELETRCISPIHETQREDEGEVGKDDKKMDGDTDGDEEKSSKYREYRKSLLAADSKDFRLPPKMAKERLNLERARRSMLRTSSNATVRASSSASELSVNGTDTEMEYDYYDYDMDNASAVPGSLFGLDPLVLAWVPPFIPIAGEATPTNSDIPLHVLNITEDPPEETPATEEPTRPTVLPLKYLNIPNTEENMKTMNISVMSEEANDKQELVAEKVEDEDEEDDEDEPPFALNGTPTANNGKILNLDDIQFADESEESDEDL